MSMRVGLRLRATLHEIPIGNYLAAQGRPSSVGLRSIRNRPLNKVELWQKVIQLAKTDANNETGFLSRRTIPSYPLKRAIAVRL